MILSVTSLVCLHDIELRTTTYNATGNLEIKKHIYDYKSERLVELGEIIVM